MIPDRRPSSFRPAVTLAVALFAMIALLAACGGSAGGVPQSAAPSAASSAEASQGAAPACPTTQPDPLPAGETRTVTLDTGKGAITMQLESDLSPIAVGNFVALASCGYYDGTVFHRTAALQDGTPFVIQGGDPTGTGTGGPGYTIKDETVTTAYHRGTVAMARTADPDSVGSQFFIVLDDGASDVLAAYNTYQIIGEVTAGMDVADAIFAASGGAENPSTPVAITTATVSNP
jgi:cyclophilin family peptidyl-prolyl cis-trans isomerase